MDLLFPFLFAIPNWIWRIRYHDVVAEMKIPSSFAVLPCLFTLGLSIALSAGLPGPLIDNERLSVRDLTLSAGTPVSLPRHESDYVVMFLEGGHIRTTDASGKATTATRQFGQAIRGKAGTEEKFELLAGSPARLIVVELKDHKAAPVVNNSGLPNAFPRPRSNKVLEGVTATGQGFVVWNYTWQPGVPTPSHYHDKDVVVVYRFDGSLKSTPPQGEVVVNDYKAGEIRFNKADRAHTEELVKGKQSAMMLELK